MTEMTDQAKLISESLEGHVRELRTLSDLTDAQGRALLTLALRDLIQGELLLSFDAFEDEDRLAATQLQGVCDAARTHFDSSAALRANLQALPSLIEIEVLRSMVPVRPKDLEGIHEFLSERFFLGALAHGLESFGVTTTALVNDLAAIDHLAIKALTTWALTIDELDDYRVNWGIEPEEDRPLGFIVQYIDAKPLSMLDVIESYHSIGAAYPAKLSTQVAEQQPESIVDRARNLASRLQNKVSYLVDGASESIDTLIAHLTPATPAYGTLAAASGETLADHLIGEVQDPPLYLHCRVTDDSLFLEIVTEPIAANRVTLVVVDQAGVVIEPQTETPGLWQFRLGSVRDIQAMQSHFVALVEIDNVDYRFVAPHWDKAGGNHAKR